MNSCNIYCYWSSCSTKPNHSKPRSSRQSEVRGREGVGDRDKAPWKGRSFSSAESTFDPCVSERFSSSKSVPTLGAVKFSNAPHCIPNCYSTHVPRSLRPILRIRGARSRRLRAYGHAIVLPCCPMIGTATLGGMENKVHGIGSGS